MLCDYYDIRVDSFDVLELCFLKKIMEVESGNNN